MTDEESLNRVSVDPSICGGKPCIRGTRIPIAVILDGLAEGLTPEQLIDHYPQITPEDVWACSVYARRATTNERIEPQPN